MPPKPTGSLEFGIFSMQQLVGVTVPETPSQLTTGPSQSPAALQTGVTAQLEAAPKVSHGMSVG